MLARIAEYIIKNDLKKACKANASEKAEKYLGQQICLQQRGQKTTTS